MSSIKIVFLCFFFVSIFSHSQEYRESANIVFSGHSLTDAAVPTVRAIARFKENELNDVYQSIPGSPIRVRTRGDDISSENNWGGYGLGLQNGINLIDELRNPTSLPSGQRYDTLVVAESHDLPTCIQYESTTSLLRHFHDRLLESSEEGRTYFYNAWLYIDKNNPYPWIEYELNSLVMWECVASKVNFTLANDGLPTNVRTLAAGWAMAHMVSLALEGNIPGLEGSQIEILDQIFEDDVHPTALGNLFVGAYAYSDLFGQSPEGFPIPPSISEETGNALLTLAWDLVQQYHSEHNQYEHDMPSCRDHMANSICEIYWTYFFNEPEQVANCQNFFGREVNGNPFRWPDPALVTWPRPGGLLVEDSQSEDIPFLPVWAYPLLGFFFAWKVTRKQ